MPMLPLLILTLAGCDELGRNAAKVVPALEKVNDDYAEPTMECEPALTAPTSRNGLHGKLTCGSSIEGGTQGGSRKWGDDFYQKAFCAPARQNYDNSPEVVYELMVPADLEAEVRLVSDCVDLDLVGVAWGDESRLPEAAHGRSIAQCDMDTGRKGGKLRLNAVGKDTRYLVGVDGKNGATGNYRISVKCYTFR
ncbi:MAG: hypothetical protein H6742_01840 [Alphaproteobacteria bacterium]|nr:hypothetical protein [Alphaproteobacteria bacterium]